MQTEKAVEFLRQAGDTAMLALGEFAVGRGSAEGALAALSAHQNPDGGWAKIDKDMTADLSTISQTWLGLQYLVWLYPSGGENAAKTTAFLKAAQHPDGCWDEPSAITQYNPPPWMLPGETANRVWLTLAVCCKLKELGAEKNVDFDAALRYVRSQWDGSRFPGVTHPYWMAMPLFYLHDTGEPLDRQIMNRSRDILLEAVAGDNLDPLDVTSVAHAALTGGQLAGELYDRAMQKVLQNQADDGGWTTRYGDHHRPQATVEALFLLRRANAIREPNE